MIGIMSKEQIMSCKEEVLTAVNVSGVLGASPNTIRAAAVENPDALGFPVIVMASRVKIPREPFCRFMGWLD